MDYIPDESAIQTDAIEVDKDTLEMLRGMNMANLPGISVVQPQVRVQVEAWRGGLQMICGLIPMATTLRSSEAVPSFVDKHFLPSLAFHLHIGHKVSLGDAAVLLLCVVLYLLSAALPL